MGCINSKVMIGSRSMSIRDDLINHNSLSWEELLITSQSGTDQLIALVCSTNNKPRTDENPKTAGPADISMTTTTTTGGGSRSFHTVEEYDALLENIRKFSTRSIRHFDDDDDEDSIFEAGWKRKAAAKGLEPLQVSMTTIEFPEVARPSWERGERIGDDSPGTTYMTPKFGSYNNNTTTTTKKRVSKIGSGGGEESSSSVFSRELVTAFEDCMKQLRDDEASILWEIDGLCSEA